MATDAQFHDSIEVNLELDCPFKASRPKRLNEFGIPVKRQYRSEDVATALGVSTELLRWRFRTGKYLEVSKDFGRQEDVFTRRYSTSGQHSSTPVYEIR